MITVCQYTINHLVKTFANPDKHTHTIAGGQTRVKRKKEKKPATILIPLHLDCTGLLSKSLGKAALRGGFGGRGALGHR